MELKERRRSRSSVFGVYLSIHLYISTMYIYVYRAAQRNGEGGWRGRMRRGSSMKYRRFSFFSFFLLISFQVRCVVKIRKCSAVMAV